MKTKSKPRFVIMSCMVAVLAAVTWSCNKDDDPSLTDLREDKLQYLEDSLRISDSLRLTNSAGIVNYAITVVDGSTSSIYASADGIGGSRTAKTQSAVEGAVVTISQYGKTETDTTDASGMVVFTGFFRSSASVTVRKQDFTPVSYIAGVHLQDTTPNGSISFVGNLIPVFATAGPNTATISGRATIQTDLTNKTRETVPDGTTVFAAIDATPGSEFSDRFLTRNFDELRAEFLEACECSAVYVGSILQASYGTGVIGTVTGGNYSLTVPGAIDGLPMKLEYSDIAADQTLFEFDGSGTDDRTSIYRTLFGPNIFADFIPSGSSVVISFVTNNASATGSAHVSVTSGEVESINLINDGAGYSGTPVVQIVGSGTGATATATVSNGVITGIAVNNPGSGYEPGTTVNILDGDGFAAASVSTLAQDGSVLSVVIENSGFGYTSAPTVTFSDPTGTMVTGVTATGTATISNGRVTGVTITNAGAGYIAAPTVTFSAVPAGGVDAVATAYYSGQSIHDVQVTNPGSEYSYAPAVVFSAPDIAPGVTPRATALINAVTGQVTGIRITDDGMGYINPPTVTLVARTVPASAEVFLSGGSVLSVDILSQGSEYTSAPAVVFSGGGGQGAAGTAIMADGKVIGVDITDGGSGYISTPAVNFVSGTGAAGFATVVNGAISGITITDGGHSYTGAPAVTISSSVGGGASATAVVTGGAITGVNMVDGGTGYLEGNTPSGAGVGFSTTKFSPLQTKPGVKYINDIYYGTGDKED